MQPPKKYNWNQEGMFWPLLKKMALTLIFLFLLVLVIIPLSFALDVLVKNSAPDKTFIDIFQEEFTTWITLFNTYSGIIGTLGVIIGSYAIFHFATKRHEMLMMRGTRQFAPIIKIEKYTIEDDGIKKMVRLTLEHKKKFRKVWSFQEKHIPNCKKGDSLLIIYDPLNPDFCNVATKNGKIQIRKNSSLRHPMKDHGLFS